MLKLITKSELKDFEPMGILVYSRKDEEKTEVLQFRSVDRFVPTKEVTYDMVCLFCNLPIATGPKEFLIDYINKEYTAVAYYSPKAASCSYMTEKKL